jgi:tetratricopeptide (TPR) repeat protein
MEGQLLENQVNEFRELLKEDEQRAYHRYGVTLLHSLDEETYFREMSRFGWEPQTALDFYNQGVLATNRGTHEEALSLYEEALKRDERLACAYYNLAFTCEALEQKDQQAEALERYLDLMSEFDRRDLSDEEAAEIEEAKQALAALRG